MSSLQDAAWVMLGLICVGLLGLAIGIYYWKKSQMRHKLNATPQHHPNFEAMASSELNRAGNMKHLMPSPKGRRAPSSGYDAPLEVSSHMEVAEFQPQNAASASLTSAAPESATSAVPLGAAFGASSSGLLPPPKSLKVDQQMTASADASLFENPYFTNRDFEFPEIAHQSSTDVFADDSIEVDESYIDGVIKITGITSEESADHDDPRYPKPLMTSSSDYTRSELVLADDDEDFDYTGKMDISGITTGESSDDPKDAKRKISAGSLKLDKDMREARRLSADFRPGSLKLPSMYPGGNDSSDNDVVIVNKSDLENNSDSPKSLTDLSPSFETIDAPSISVAADQHQGSGTPSFMDGMNFQGFGDGASSQDPSNKSTNPFADSTQSDNSLESDYSIIGISRDEIGDFVGGGT